MVLANWLLCEGWVKGYWFILFSDPRVSLRNKMSTVLITGRTDGKKTQTVTTPAERQPTFQNKQTKNTKQWVLKDVTHVVKVFFFSPPYAGTALAWLTKLTEAMSFCQQIVILNFMSLVGSTDPQSKK